MEIQDQCLENINLKKQKKKYHNLIKGSMPAVSILYTASQIKRIAALGSLLMA